MTKSTREKHPGHAVCTINSFRPDADLPADEPNDDVRVGPPGRNLRPEDTE